MRVVLDTNVIVSGVFWAGVPRQILRLAVSRQFHACMSVAIMTEYTEVLHRLGVRFGRLDWAGHWNAEIIERFTVVHGSYRYDDCRDSDDAMFVECAVNAGASYVVSGDDDLLSLRKVEDVVILTPAQFLDCLNL